MVVRCRRWMEVFVCRGSAPVPDSTSGCRRIRSRLVQISGSVKNGHINDMQPASSLQSVSASRRRSHALASTRSRHLRTDKKPANRRETFRGASSTLQLATATFTKLYSMCVGYRKPGTIGERPRLASHPRSLPNGPQLLRNVSFS